MTTGIVALLLRLILAVIFAVAGAAKLTDLERTRKTVRDFGLPAWIASPLSILLPITELVIAGLLIPVATVVWGTLGAIALLVAFVIGISINLSLGRKPECNCFGQVHSEPIGWTTLARNCLLLCSAAFVLWSWRSNPPISLLTWMAGLSRIEVVALLLGISQVVLVTLGAWLAFHLLRQNGRLLLRMDALETQLATGTVPQALANTPSGPPVGTPAPYFDLLQLNGSHNVTLHTLLTGRLPIILIFSDPECRPCSALLPDIARWEREYAQRLTFALISRRTLEANKTKLGENSLRYVLLQKDREVSMAYQVSGTPGAILIGSDGRVASPLAMGSEGIAVLIATAVRPKSANALLTNGSNGSANHAAVPGLNIGESAPSIRLPDLDGKIVDLADFESHDTVVLFWNPTCGFCAKMLPDLKLWEAQRDSESRKLLVISTGSVEANQAMGLQSPIVLDQAFATGRAFQVRGTPSAVLVDADGNIASGVASGAPAVLALANARQSQSVG